MSSYLDLHWLAKSEKDVLLPPVVYASLDCGGIYYWPFHRPVVLEGREYSRKRGLIAVDSDNGHIGSTLAHEWRHLIQRHRGWPSWATDWERHAQRYRSYREAIVAYFVNCPSEYDALLFELKTYPTDTNRQWYEWILKRNDPPKVEEKK